MSYDSVEAEERFQEHLKELAAMSPEEKRRYAKTLDRIERLNEDRGNASMLFNREVTLRTIVRDGSVGVHRADYLKN